VAPCPSYEVLSTWLSTSLTRTNEKERDWGIQATDQKLGWEQGQWRQWRKLKDRTGSMGSTIRDKPGLHGKRLATFADGGEKSNIWTS
jgi:hypothetical protein